MTPQHDDKTILDYVEGDLPDDQRKRFETILADDPKLRLLVTQIRSDRQQMRDLPSEAPPEDILDGVNRRLERNMLLDAPPPELMPSRPTGSFRIGRWAAYAGLAAMIMLSTTLVIHTLSDGRLYDQFTAPRDKQESTYQQQQGARPVTREMATRSEDTAPAIAQSDAQENLQGPLAAAPANTSARDLPLEPPLQATPIPEEEASSPVAAAKSATELAKTSLSSVSIKTSPQAKIKTFAKLTPATDVDHTQDDKPSPLVMRVLGHIARVDEGQSLSASDGMITRRDTDVLKRVDAPKPLKDDEAASAVIPVIRYVETSIVDVTTQDPQATQTAVLSWAIANGVQIVGLISHGAPQTPANAHTWPQVIGAARTSELTQQVRLRIASSQLPRLVADLDLIPGITATAAGVPLPWRYEEVEPGQPSAPPLLQAATETTSSELDAETAAPTQQTLNEAALADNPKPSRPDTGPEPGVDDDFRALSLEDALPGSFDRSISTDNPSATWPSPLSQTDWIMLLRRWVPVHPTVPIYKPGTQLLVTVNIHAIESIDSNTDTDTTQ